jgi:hypothetical protein
VPVANTCNPSYSGGRKSQFEASPGQRVCETLSGKYLTQNAGRVAQVVKHLPSKCEALSSNPSTGAGM